jgi:hypothetical protein
MRLEPPLGLPMFGFVRQKFPALGYGFPLEVGAIALERDGTRVVLCGVDIVGIVEPELGALLDRVAAATGAAREGILLNWSHTHLAPTGGRLHGASFGEVSADAQYAIDSFARVVQDKIVTVAQLAFEQLEPARVVWGQRSVDVAVNRRERRGGDPANGTILGWNPDELVDQEVTTLQLRRPDESVISTLVCYGCHPVTTGYDMYTYSADFPGPLRDTVRSVTRGECVFFQGSGGNVLPRFAFTDNEAEALRMGNQLALSALDSVADRLATPVEVVRLTDGSVTPISTYRRSQLHVDEPVLIAASEIVTIPLLPHPSLDVVSALRREYEQTYLDAQSGDDLGQVKVAYFRVDWARRIEEQLRAGTAPTEVTGPVHAVRIGDGVIVTGPGETFTEYGVAVKERSPGRPTIYAGYTNGLIGYFSTAAEYEFGGYESGYAYMSVGLPSLFDPRVEEILVSSGVRLAETLFPDHEPWDSGRGRSAHGRPPQLDNTAFEYPSHNQSN